MTNTKSKGGRIATVQTALVVMLRVAVGWHFLYEGVSKLRTPGWTSEGYLRASRWIFSGAFEWMASNPSVLRAVDLLNMWGLTLIGLSLMLGLFARAASVGGAALILLYYVSNPPLVGTDFGVVREGSYLFVDKNLVELFALCVLAVVPSSRHIGLDRILAHFVSRIRTRKPKEGGKGEGEPSAEEQVPSLNRRDLIKSAATTPFLGAFALAVADENKWKSHEEKQLVDAVTSATIKTFNFSTLKDLKGQAPTAKIAGVEFSRLILGGNLIGGWAHARDLIYVSSLVKAYHHRDKVFETFLLAENCGINAILTNPILCDIINDYWRRRIGKIKFISDCGGGLRLLDFMDHVKQSIDRGASACYVQGETADRLVRMKRFDLIAAALEEIRKNGLPAGIGAHRLETVTGCVEKGLEPDFWMKTLHQRNYWSARPKQEWDNIFCRKPEETVAFMKGLKQPWIAFKTLAAGAIHPKQGFRYAFENGADFICVGMYDFQMVEDANVALEILGGELKRERPWMA